MAIVCAITMVSVYLLTETYQNEMDEAETFAGVSEPARGRQNPATG